MVLISLVSVLKLLYFYISTFRSMCAVPNMAVFCSLLLLLLSSSSLLLWNSALQTLKLIYISCCERLVHFYMLEITDWWCVCARVRACNLIRSAEKFFILGPYFMWQVPFARPGDRPHARLNSRGKWPTAFVTLYDVCLRIGPGMRPRYVREACRLWHLR